MRRTGARWWVETPEGELIHEFVVESNWLAAYRQAVAEKQRLIFRSEEMFETRPT